MDVMGLQDQLLIVEKIISKALNLWSRASLYMLEFKKKKKKKICFGIKYKKSVLTNLKYIYTKMEKSCINDQS